MLDILCQKQSTAASFEVNTALPSVNLSIPDPDASVLYDGRGKAIFTAEDNFTLLSLGYKLPLSFEFLAHTSMFWGSLPVSFITTYAITAPGGIVTVLTPQYILMPYDNYEMNYGSFYKISDYPNLAGKLFYISLRFQPAQSVSMLNIPAALNEQTFHVPIYAKILHNFFLIDLI